VSDVVKALLKMPDPGSSWGAIGSVTLIPP
jgi:hypothetical protein